MKADIMRIFIAILMMLITATLTLGQSEAELRGNFEGRRVVILVDMPADEDGINIEVDKGRSIDRSQVGKDLSRYGTAIRQGSTAEITLIKKKGKHIEFQLNGGGWQGGRAAGLNYTPAPKSERHKNIEAELALLPNPSDDSVQDKKLRLRKILKEDLRVLTRDYDAVNANRMAQALENQAQAQVNLNSQILASGSRFNLRFDRNVPPEALTPQGFMGILEKYVDFSPEAVHRASQKKVPQTVETAAEPAQPRFEPASAEEILKNLRKGLLWEDAVKLMGSPSHDVRYEAGRFRIKECTFDLAPLGTVDAEFVEDVLVRFTVYSQ